MNFEVVEILYIFAPSEETARNTPSDFSARGKVHGARVGTEFADPNGCGNAEICKRSHASCRAWEAVDNSDNCQSVYVPSG